MQWCSEVIPNIKLWGKILTVLMSCSKPHIHPVEVMPVLPDSNMWKYPCAQVIHEYQNCWSGHLMTNTPGDL